MRSATSKKEITEAVQKAGGSVSYQGSTRTMFVHGLDQQKFSGLDIKPLAGMRVVRGQ